MPIVEILPGATGQFAAGFCFFLGLILYSQIVRKALVGFLCLSVAGFALLAPATDGSSVILEDYNLRFERPEHPWVTMDPTHFDTDAQFIIRRASPEIWIMVVPEIVGIEEGFYTTVLGEVVRSNLSSLGQGASFGPVEQMEAMGIAGETMNARARSGGTYFHYDYWYGSHNGLMLQVVAFGNPDDADEVYRAHRAFLTGMELIDPEKIFTTTGDLIEEAVERPDDGFRLVFDRPEWIYSEALAEEFPAAAFTARSIYGAQLQVLRLDLAEPISRMDAIIEGLLYVQDMVLEDQEVLLNRNTAAPEGTTIRELKLRIPVGTDSIHDHYRIIKRDGRIWMINTWIEGNLIDERWNPDAILESMELITEAVLSTTETFSAARRVAKCQILNKIGLYYFMRDDFDTALAYFRVAVEMDPENHYAAGNIVHSHFMKGNYEETIDKAKHYLAQFPEHNDLWLDKVEAMWELERTEELGAVYARIFATGMGSDYWLGKYLHLLIEQDQLSEAREVIEREADQDPSTYRRRWKAEILRLSDDFEAAEKELLHLAEQEGWSSTLFGDIVALYEGHGEFEEALGWIDRQEEQIGASYSSRMTRGRIQMEMGNFEGARASFEEALQKRPHDAVAQEALDHAISLIP